MHTDKTEQCSTLPANYSMLGLNPNILPIVASAPSVVDCCCHALSVYIVKVPYGIFMCSPFTLCVISDVI